MSYTVDNARKCLICGQSGLLIFTDYSIWCPTESAWRSDQQVQLLGSIIDDTLPDAQ